MKKLLLILFVLCFTGIAYAHQVTLEWDASPAPDLTGYKLYQSTSPNVQVDPSNLVATIPAGTEEAVLEVPTGVYYWIVTAYRDEGVTGSYRESAPSNELGVSIPTLDPPQSLKIRVIVEVLVP